MAPAIFVNSTEQLLLLLGLQVPGIALFLTVISSRSSSSTTPLGRRLPWTRITHANV